MYAIRNTHIFLNISLRRDGCLRGGLLRTGCSGHHKEDDNLRGSEELRRMLSAFRPSIENT